MNLEAISATSDAIASIAVVVSIGFLAYQVKSNNRLLKSAARQSIVDEFKSSNRLMTDDAEHFALGMRDYPNLPFLSLSKYSGIMTDTLLSFQSSLALRQAGTLDKRVYEAYLTFTASLLVTPGGQVYWRQFRNIFIPEMVLELDTKIAKGHLDDLLQLPQFNISWDKQNSSQ